MSKTTPHIRWYMRWQSYTFSILLIEYKIDPMKINYDFRAAFDSGLSPREAAEEAARD